MSFFISSGNFQSTIIFEYLTSIGEEVFYLGKETTVTKNDTVFILYDTITTDTWLTIDQAQSIVRFSSFYTDKSINLPNFSEIVDDSQSLLSLVINYMESINDYSNESYYTKALKDIGYKLSLYQQYDMVTNYAGFLTGMAWYYLLNQYRGRSATQLIEMLKIELSEDTAQDILLYQLLNNIVSTVFSYADAKAKQARLLLRDTIGVCVTLNEQYNNEVAYKLIHSCEQDGLLGIAIAVRPIRGFSSSVLTIRCSKQLDALAIANHIGTKAKGNTHSAFCFYNESIDSLLQRLETVTLVS